MQHRRFCAPTLVTAVFAATAVAAGCGGGPTAPSARATAKRFDSLYVAAILAGTHGDSLRASLLTYLEVAASSGAVPVPVTVTTASGAQKWQALSFAIADTSGSASATTLTVTIVYSDNNATNAVLSEVTTGGATSVYSEMVAADTIYVVRTTATAIETETHRGACAQESGLSNPFFAVLPTRYQCSLGTFEGSLNASFPNMTGVDPALTQVSFTSLTSNGARLADATP